MMAHTDHMKKKREKVSELIRRLDAVNRCYEFRDSKDLVLDILARTQHFPADYMKNEYLKWANYWYLPMKEVDHV